MKNRYTIIDANESIFFARELEHVKAKSFDVKFPNLQFAEGNLIPISFEGDPGDDNITYQQFDQVGLAKVIANYANDLPRADVKGREFTAKVKGLGASYGYTIQEIRASKKTGRAIDQRRSVAAKRSVMEKLDRIALNGDTSSGLQGLLTNPNITEVVLANDGTGSLKTFASKTADQIIRDLHSLANTINTVTNGVEKADTLLIPLIQYSLITNKQKSVASDKVIKDFFLASDISIKEIIPVVRLAGAGAGGTDRMIAYKRDPEHLTLEIPQDYEQFPAQEKGLEFEIPVHMRTGGVLIYYPLAIAFADGI